MAAGDASLLRFCEWILFRHRDKAITMTSETGADCKLYSSWFCPFAQRVWIALLEKNVDFEYIEVDPYKKTQDWLEISPRGLVPVLRHNGKSIYESSICLEYIDEAWSCKSPALLPVKDAYGRARSRMWMDHISRRIVPAFYQILQAQQRSEQDKAAVRLLGAVRQFSEELEVPGPFFFGSTIGSVDLMLIPFALRFEDILGHYRQFKIPDHDEIWERYHVWLEAVKKLDSVKQTLPDTGELVKKYQRYADNTASSEVAEAIRTGSAMP